MKDVEVLARLQTLKEISEREGFPASDDAFYAWAEDVHSTLLYASAQYYSSFNDCLETIQSDRIGVSDDQRGAAYERINAIVSEVILHVRQRAAYSSTVEAPPPPPPPFTVPDHVTARWLFDHVGWRTWVAALGLAAIVFLGGMYFAHSRLYTKWYKDLTTPATANDATTTTSSPNTK